VNKYNKGSQVKCSVTFSDAAGDAADPSAVVFRYKDPPGVIRLYTYGVDGELVKDETGTGIYYVNLTPAVHGKWHYRFEGTGAVIAAGESQFEINRSVF